MGQEEVPGHVEAGGDGRAEQEGGGLEQGGAEAASINLRKNLDGTLPYRHLKLRKATFTIQSKRGAPATERLNRLYAKGLAAPITRPGALTERSVTPIPGHESMIRPFPM